MACKERFFAGTITAKCLRYSVWKTKLTPAQFEELTRGMDSGDDIPLIKEENEEDEGMKLE